MAIRAWLEIIGSAIFFKGVFNIRFAVNGGGWAARHGIRETDIVKMQRVLDQIPGPDLACKDAAIESQASMSLT